MTSGTIKLVAGEAGIPNNATGGFVGQVYWESELQPESEYRGCKLTLYFQVARTGVDTQNSSEYDGRFTLYDKSTGKVALQQQEFSTGYKTVYGNGGWTTIYKISGLIPYAADVITRELTIDTWFWSYQHEVEFWDTEDSGTMKLASYDAQKATITSAPNFNDENNPSISYNVPAANTVTSLQACIADKGGNTIFVPYRDINKNSKNYTFTLTEAERKTLRKAAKANTLQVAFYVKSVIGGKNYYSSSIRTLTIVNNKPVLSPVVEDINIKTTTLTGNSSMIVKGYSNMNYVLLAEPKKEATIVSYSVTNGGVTKTTADGTFNSCENNIFTFSATDSRGNTTTQEVRLDMINYYKVSCQQNVSMIMNDDDTSGAQIRLIVDGDYFNQSFGARNNTLEIWVRNSENNGAMGEWGEITPLIQEIKDGKYLLTANVSGFDVSGSYTFQCKAVDALSEATTAEYTVKFLPVFDWSATDFNFNVPIDMNNYTVLRATDTNRLVVSAGGGGIYLRPNGTSNETGQVQIGTNGAITINGSALADFIVEQGTTAMGTNGTWYWSKWKSGKAECYGTRNFGSMSINKAWGSMYLSPSFTQAFPSGLFVATPHTINIQLKDGGTFGAILLTGHETVPSKDNTGTFQLARAVVGSPTKSDIAFHAIGNWK